MKIKITLSCILVLSFAFLVKAQKEEFNLSTYTPPNYVYKSLDLNYDISGNASYDAVHLGDNLVQKNIIKYFSTSISPEYFRYSNRENYQGSNDLQLYAGISINKDDPYNASYSSDQNHLQSGNAVKINYDGENRFYLADKKFFEIDPTVRLITQTTKYTDKTYVEDTLALQITTTLWRPEVYFSAPILFGFGRINNIMDARHALYILDDLKKAGRLSREFKDNDILTIASGITKLKNKRFFDSRLRKIEELVALDSLLRSTGLNGETDALFYATLNDSWSYPGVMYRYSGYRIYGGIDPEYQLNYNKTEAIWKFTPDDSKSWENNSVTYLGLIVGFKHERPVSLRWQSALDLSAGYGIEQTLRKGRTILPEPTDTREWKTTQQRGTLSADYGVGFYPNSRTWLNAGFQADMLYYGKGTNKPYAQEESDMQPSLFLNLGPSANAWIYLSPQLSISFTAAYNYHYGWNKSQDEVSGNSSNDAWNLYLRSYIRYSLF